MIVQGVEYGPLGGLIGRWEGEGLDIAPHPSEGEVRTPFYDVLEFEPIGTVVNAASQVLSALFYRHKVYNKSGAQFHDQCGHLLYDTQEDTIIHTFSIPRGVCVLGTGGYRKEGEGVSIEINSSEQMIASTPFMQAHARTTAYAIALHLENERLVYTQTTQLSIYGRSFEHIDESVLAKKG